MYVSTVNVLRRFAQKMAAIDIKDPAHMLPAEPAEWNAQMNVGPDASDKTRGALPKPDMSDRARLAVHAGREAVGKGIDAVADAGKSMGHSWASYASPTTLGVGGMGGAALLYAIAKMRQSEEERKRGKQPILAPALGLAGGAAVAPLIAAMYHRYQNPLKGPPLPGDLQTMDATGNSPLVAPPNRPNAIHTA